MTRLTLADVRRANYCLKGAREHCELAGIDYRSFVRNGYILVEDLPEGDAVIDHIMRVKANG